MRALHLAAVEQAAWWGVLQGDAEGYVRWASKIAAGDWVGSEGFYQAPLYPYTLSVIEVLFGAGIWPIVVLQSLAGSLTALLVGAVAASLWGRRKGLVAGLLMATYAPAIYFDGIIQKASLTGLVTAAIALIVVTKDKNGRNWPVFVVGLLSAAACLLREQAFVWLPMLLVWSWARGQCVRTRHRWAGPVLYLGGTLLVFMPVGWRNAAVSGEWSISTFQAGPNFYIGNHAGAEGRYDPLVRGHETPEFEREDATRLAEQATGRRMSPREVSSYWTRLAIRDIRSDPAAWLALVARKLRLVFNRFEVADVESQYVVAEFSPVLRLLGWFWHFGILLPFAVVGVVATLSQWRRAWPVCGMALLLAAAIAVTFVSARYRYPMSVVLMPFAAAGLGDLVSTVQSRCWRRITGRVLLAGAVALASNVPVQDEDRLTGLAFMNLGVAMAKAGDLAAATSCFQEAVLRHPDSAEANNNLAQALALQGGFEQAIVYYRRALAEAPGLPGVAYNLGVALERTGRKSEAIARYRQAATQDPRDEEAKAALQRLSGSSP